jgi:hypothetical protein
MTLIASLFLTAALHRPVVIPSCCPKITELTRALVEKQKQ